MSATVADPTKAPLPPPPLFALPKSKKPPPLVAHPKASMASDPDLRVQGQSKVASLNIASMNAEAAARKCHPFVGSELRQTLRPKQSLPPLTARSQGIASRAASVDGSIYKHVDKGKYRNTIGESPRYNTSELMYLLHNKVQSTLHGLKHLFKSNDPSGQGRVTRTCLEKILFHLVGYISPDECSKLFSSLGLHGKQTISFDDFVSCFRDTEQPELVEWLVPYHRVSVSQQAPTNPEEHLRQPSGWSPRQQVSAALLYTQLRMAARNREFSICDVLPDECFKGSVIPPHLKAMLDTLGYNISGQEFMKLWHRFDTKQIGAVKLKAFMDQLGLDQEGIPLLFQRADSMMAFGPKQRKIKVHKRPKEEKETEAAAEGEVATESRELTKEQRKTMKKVTKKPSTFKMNDVIDNLFYVFDEPFQALIQGMECFDFESDGHVARIDLQKVLAEFGFQIDAMDLEYFLSRIGVRTINGQISYREFLLKFWNRSPMGMVNRILSNPKHPFNKGEFSGNDNGKLTGPELEAALVEKLHGKYLALLSSLKAHDIHNVGVVKQYNFREALEKCLGYAMEPKQWDKLKEKIGIDADGLVPYPQFLNIFNIKEPGLWNRKEQVGQMVAKVRRIETPAAVNKLKAMSQEDLNKNRLKLQERQMNKPKFTQNIDKMIANIAKPEPISVENMQMDVYSLFKQNFALVDQAFKMQDRRMTGRFGKVQFVEILRSCGSPWTPNDITRLWESLNLDNDGLLTFTSLVRFFVDFAQTHGLPPPTEITMPPRTGLSRSLTEVPEEADPSLPFNGFHSYAYKRVPPMY